MRPHLVGANASTPAGTTLMGPDRSFSGQAKAARLTERLDNAETRKAEAYGLQVALAGLVLTWGLTLTLT